MNLKSWLILYLSFDFLFRHYFSKGFIIMKFEGLVVLPIEYI